MGWWERRLAAGERRRMLRQRAVTYLGGKCRICGYDRCLPALEFHHLDPMEKDFTISARMTSWEAIRRELKKCVLLCCRCHREVHDGLHPGYVVDESHDRGADWDLEVDVERVDPSSDLVNPCTGKAVAENAFPYAGVIRSPVA